MNSFWFIWNGKNSISDFGLWVRKLPKRTRAPERHEEVKVPGRSGSLILTEGDDIYDTYSDEMVISCKDDMDINRLLKWLRGSGELIQSDDLSRVREARIVNAVKFDWEEKSHVFVGTIPLLFQPFKHSRYRNKDAITLSSNGVIYNPGDVSSRPKVSITGTGSNVSVTIAEQTMTFTSLTGTILVDCEAGMITQNGSIWEGTFSGDFWRIPTGESVVTTSVNTVIEPEWRWL